MDSLKRLVTEDAVVTASVMESGTVKYETLQQNAWQTEVLKGKTDVVVLAESKDVTFWDQLEP